MLLAMEVIFSQQQAPTFSAQLKRRFLVSETLSMHRCWHSPLPATGRHLYAIITGILLIYYPFGNGVFHAFVPSLVTYAFMLVARKQCGRLAWLVDFSYLIGWYYSSRNVTVLQPWQSRHSSSVQVAVTFARSKHCRWENDVEGGGG